MMLRLKNVMKYALCVNMKKKKIRWGMFILILFGIMCFFADRLAVKIGTLAPSLMTNSPTTTLSLVCVTLYLITLHPSHPSTSHLTPCNPAVLSTQSTASFCEVFWCLNLCRLTSGDEYLLLWAFVCQDLSTQTSSQVLYQEWCKMNNHQVCMILHVTS